MGFSACLSSSPLPENSKNIFDEFWISFRGLLTNLKRFIMFRSVRKTLKPRRAGERPGRSTRLSNDPPRPRRVCNKGGKCLEIIGIYKNFTEITNNELSCGEQKALSDVSPMFSRLHFVLNLLVRVLSRNLLSRGASADDVSRSPANISGPLGLSWIRHCRACHLRPSSTVLSQTCLGWQLGKRESRRSKVPRRKTSFRGE